MALTLTKTRLLAGVWEGVLTGASGGEPPSLAFRLRDEVLDGLTLRPEGDRWIVHAAIPADRICDGVQTFVILDAETEDVLASFALLSGEALAEDIRAEVDLLRDELDMLKRAFRRHCLETGLE
ncbi:MAG: hypothetical protein R6V30_12040 [Paracoccaceae bacterium]